MEKIIYEDKYLLAVHKRGGLATQTSKLGQKDLVNEVLNYLKEKNGDMKPYAGLINRLDQPVEGIVLFGLDKNTTASLTAQLQSGGMEKHYYAALAGVPEIPDGLVVDYMKKDAKTNTSCICEADEEGAQKAILEYKLISEKNGLSLADIHLVTGRHHQIRLQMSAAGLPLLGDRKYAPLEVQKKSDELGIKSVALCAYKLGFEHPKFEERIELTTQPMESWMAIFDNDTHSQLG